MVVPPVDSDSDSDDELYQLEEADHITHGNVSAPAQGESASQETPPPGQDIPPTVQPVPEPPSSPTPDAEEESVASSTDDDQPPAATEQTTEHEEDALQLDEPSTSESVPATTSDMPEHVTEPYRRPPSLRPRKKPRWMRGGEYQVNQQIVTTSEPEWKVRADYLQSLSSSGIFHSVNSEEVAKTLLNIVAGKT